MKTIDEMIAVMTAYKEGKKIECKRDALSPISIIDNRWFVDDFPVWNWGTCEYRIKEIDDKRYIDMGLPSGRLWCDSNEEGYFSFKDATDKFGDSLPTKEEYQELIDNSYHKWDNERKGVVFYSRKTDSELFFPAAGYRDGSSVNYVESYGVYWSSSPHEYSGTHSYTLSFVGSSVYIGNNYRGFSCPIRLIK